MALPPPITLQVRNFSTVVTDLGSGFRVLWEQANNDLHLYWGGDGVPFVHEIVEITGDRWPAPSNNTWRATIYDYPSQALDDDDLAYMPVSAVSAIGYHFPDNGYPHLVVFAANGISLGIPWTMTLSHELLEALVDPSGTETRPRQGVGYTDEYYELEICDPVQAQAYPISDRKTGDTHWVSNFVTPMWFDFDPKDYPPLRGLREHIRYDFAGQLIAPRQLALGGQRTLKLADSSDRGEVLTRLGSLATTGE
jgi:hypothetical protein